MPVSVVQTKVKLESSLTATHTLVFDSSVTVGNWVVILWRRGTNNRSPGVPSPSAGTWSGVQDYFATSGSTNIGDFWQWSAQQTVAATDTYTITISGSATSLGAIVGWELSGVDVSGTPRGDIGTQNLASATSFNLIGGSGITLTDGDILIGAASTQNASWGTLTAPSNFTTRLSNNSTSGTIATFAGDRLTAGSGITAGASITTGRSVTTGYAVYKQTSGGAVAAKTLLLLGVGA